MKRLTAGLVVAALSIAACGVDSGGIDLPRDDDSPVLQVRSEGGFAPVEFILGQGPRYTLLADGRLISEGPVIAIYPGPLLPNYQVTTITDDQMRSVLDVVARIGLPDMIDEIDDTNTRTVADATTEVVTYWDESGPHRYSVYALGLVDTDAVRAETAAFQELTVLLDQLSASGDSVSYTGDVVQVVAGPGFENVDFPDVRDWPLPGDDLTGWKTLPNGWKCATLGSDVIGRFSDATEATQWTNPGTAIEAETVKLLVRPLLPGENPCFGN